MSWLKKFAESLSLQSVPHSVSCKGTTFTIQTFEKQYRVVHFEDVFAGCQDFAINKMMQAHRVPHVLPAICGFETANAAHKPVFCVVYEHDDKTITLADYVNHRDKRPFNLDVTALLHGLFQLKSLLRYTYPSEFGTMVSMIHGDLCPENIILRMNSQGQVEWHLHNFAKSTVKLLVAYQIRDVYQGSTSDFWNDLSSTVVLALDRLLSELSAEQLRIDLKKIGLYCHVSGDLLDKIVREHLSNELVDEWFVKEENLFKHLWVPLHMQPPNAREQSIEYPIPKRPYWFKGLIKLFRKLYPSRTPSFKVIDYSQNAVDVLVHGHWGTKRARSYMSYVIQDELGTKFVIRKYFEPEVGTYESSILSTLNKYKVPHVIKALFSFTEKETAASQQDSYFMCVEYLDGARSLKDLIDSQDTNIELNLGDILNGIKAVQEIGVKYQWDAIPTPDSPIRFFPNMYPADLLCWRNPMTGEVEWYLSNTMRTALKVLNDDNMSYRLITCPDVKLSTYVGDQSGYLVSRMVYLGQKLFPLDRRALAMLSAIDSCPREGRPSLIQKYSLVIGKKRKSSSAYYKSTRPAKRTKCEHK